MSDQEQWSNTVEEMADDADAPGGHQPAPTRPEQGTDPTPDAPDPAPAAEQAPPTFPAPVSDAPAPPDAPRAAEPHAATPPL